MRSAAALLAFSLLPSALSQATRSPKRGLVFTPSTQHPQDNAFWNSTSSDITWYYNYGPTPSPDYVNSTQLEFIPMLFAAPPSASDTSFLDTLQGLLQGGANITHVLSFNEPDGPTSNGGSNINPSLAAITWQRELEPLRAHGVKIGAPAVTGSPQGLTWLQQFFDACGSGCTPDFLALHWYGSFEGLASYLGQVRATYANMTLWVTEFGYPDQDLASTQVFYNESSQYLDSLDYVERYSYFGAFRSDASNIGPNAAMLTADGKLTDIGSWYLGGSATGNIPSSAPRAIVSLPVTLLISVAAAFFWIA